MSRYQEALSSIMFTMHNRVTPKKLGRCEDDNLEILQELVDKANPMKPIDIKSRDIEFSFVCPRCRQKIYTNFRRNYCSECGQALDWSEE